MLDFRVMGLLWCRGAPSRRVAELYNILQIGDHDKISHNDKSTAPTLETMFDFATRLVFEQVNIEADPDSPEAAEQITAEQIAEVEETYLDVIDEFVDNVFESDSLLSRALWEEQVCKKEAWVVQPDKIRKKLYPQLEKKKTRLR